MLSQTISLVMCRHGDRQINLSVVLAVMDDQKGSASRSGWINLFTRPMAPIFKQLEIPRKGLAKFTAKIKTRKEELSARLARAETISSLDEHWLDNEANTIDEERDLDALESALDYEQALEQLNDDGKAIVQAGDLVTIAGNKWKHTHLSSCPI